MIHLDTHVVVWLYDARLDLISEATLELMRSQPLGVSPMVILELQYLHEIGRLRVPSEVILDNLRMAIELGVSEIPLREVITYARDLPWTRDPFDRIIVGQATAEGASLITRDKRILANCEVAVRC